MRMRSLLVGLVLAVAALPAASLASPANKTDKSNANRACASLRSSLGATTFNNTYSSFGACVSKMTQTAHQARLQATAECRGKPHHSSCVNTQTHVNLNTQVNSTKNDARACAAELHSSGVQAFEKSWGTNHNLRNAFGKCVSAHAKGASHTSTTSTTSTPTTSSTARFDASLTSVGNSGVTGEAQLFLSGNELTVALSVHKFEPDKTPVANIVGPLSGTNACPSSIGTTELALGVNVAANNGGNLAFASHYTYDSSTLGALNTRAIALYNGSTLVACGQIGNH
jgi:hypothetical protein